MGFDIRPLLGGRDRDPRATPLVPGNRTKLTPRPGLADVEFLFGVVRRMARQARADAATHAGAAGAHAAATGTVDALLWVLGATDVPPSRLRSTPPLVGDLQPDDLMAVELVALENRRAMLGGGHEHYLRGAVDAVCFALGQQAAFWWAPLPASLRQTPQRDEIGRRIA